jgi:hypothetical protein
MPSTPPRSVQPQSDEIPQTLTDRVLARVTDARLAVQRRAKASRPKAKRHRRAVPNGSTAPGPQTPEQAQESESLRRVFRDLGISYRQYRRETGEPVAPALREAAYRFRADPSLTSLVSVAVFLDELDILTW